MSSITREDAKRIAAELEDAVRAVLERNGLEYTKSSTTYGDRLVWKVEASTVSLNEAGVNTQTKEARDHIDMGHYYGFPEDAAARAALLGATMVFGGKTFTYMGTNPRATKRPLIFRGEDGRLYSFTKNTAAMLMAQNMAVTA